MKVTRYLLPSALAASTLLTVGLMSKTLYEIKEEEKKPLYDKLESKINTLPSYTVVSALITCALALYSEKQNERKHTRPQKRRDLSEVLLTDDPEKN